MSKRPYITGVAFQVEPSQGAASSSPIYKLPGKLGLSYQPVLSGGGGKVNLYRQNELETNTQLYWRGSFEMEHGDNYFIAMLFQSFLPMFAGDGVQLFKFTSLNFGSFGSMKLFVDYDSGPYLQFDGLVVTAIAITVRAQAIIRTKVDFVALRKAENMSGAVTSGITNSALLATKAIVLLNNVSVGNIGDFTINLTANKVPGRFGEDKKPTRFVRDGNFDCGGEFSVAFNGADDFTVPHAVENLTECSFQAQIGQSKTANSPHSLGFIFPRVIFTAGTPPAVSKTELAYRASWKALIDADPTGTPIQVVLRFNPVDQVQPDDGRHPGRTPPPDLGRITQNGDVRVTQGDDERIIEA